MNQKTCIRCSEEKAPDEFYGHPQMADGLLGACKACCKRDERKRRRLNPDVQKYDTERSSDPKRVELRRRTSKIYRENNPSARAAHGAVERAIRSGSILKENCLFCAADKNIHGHHRDYSRPLDVVWLCAKCHRRLHAYFPETKVGGQ